MLLLAGLLLDRRAAGLRLPTWRRQVDEAWLARYRGWVYGAGFGLQLGLGVVTIVTSATVYATVLLCALSGSPPVGLALGALFGLARALPVLGAGRRSTTGRPAPPLPAAGALGPRATGWRGRTLATGRLAAAAGRDGRREELTPWSPGSG